MKRFLIAFDFSGTLSTAHSSTAFRDDFPRSDYFKLVTEDVWRALSTNKALSLVRDVLAPSPSLQSLLSKGYFNGSCGSALHTEWIACLRVLTTSPHVTVVVCTDHCMDAVDAIVDAFHVAGIAAIPLREGRRTTPPGVVTPGAVYVVCSAEAGHTKASPGFWSYLASFMSFEHLLLVDDFGAHEYGGGSSSPSDVVSQRNAVARALRESDLKGCDVELYTFETGVLCPPGKDPLREAGPEALAEAIKRSCAYVGGYLVSRLPQRVFYFGTSSSPSPTPPYDVVVMLNSPLPLTPSEIAAWNSAGIRVCADGAINRCCEVGGPLAMPHVLIGDMDSVSAESLALVAQCHPSISVVTSSDQDTTDFEKCLTYLGATHKTVCVCGALGGRADHHLGVYHVLMKHSVSLIPHLVVMSQGTTSVCVGLGRTTLHGIHAGTKCGILPLCGPTGGVATQGLAWELDGLWMAFGETMVSTSNEVKGNVVVVDNIHRPMLWVHYN